MSKFTVKIIFLWPLEWNVWSKRTFFSVVYRSQKSRLGSCFVSFRHQELSFLNCEIVTRSQKLCKNLDLFTNTILKLLWSDRKYVAKAEVGSSLISLYGNTRALHSGAIFNFLSGRFTAVHRAGIYQFSVWSITATECEHPMNTFFIAIPIFWAWAEKLWR